jgi:transposase
MRQLSSYPKQFKAQVVQECLQPGATIVSVQGIRLAQIS